MSDSQVHQNKIRRTILVVDDEPDMLAAISEYLEMLDKYKVLTAEDGQKADAIINQNKVDLVFSDVRMPNLTGIELLKKIRNKDKDIPIVVLYSGYMDLSPQELLEMGANAFLNKPVDLEEVEQIIDNTLNNLDKAG